MEVHDESIDLYLSGRELTTNLLSSRRGDDFEKKVTNIFLFIPEEGRGLRSQHVDAVDDLRRTGSCICDYILVHECLEPEVLN